MTAEDVKFFLEKSQNLLILCHSNADPDALGCALAVKRFYPDKSITIISDGMSKPAKTMYENFNIPLGNMDKNTDSILILDTSSPELLGKYEDLLKMTENIAVIDHHSTCAFEPKFEYRHCATSNAELVWEILERPDDIVIRKLLLTGLLADTGHMKFSNRDTIRAVYEMLGNDIVFEDIYTMLQEGHDLSKKVALMKALQRMRIVKLDDFFIVKTNIGAHESFIAKNIMSLGADIVIIVNDRKGERIVVRAKRSTVDKGVDLAKITNEIGSKYGGHGGGHPAAAGLMGIKNYKDATEDMIKVIKSILKVKRK